jgi:hypothetical protein
MHHIHGGVGGGVWVCGGCGGVGVVWVGVLVLGVWRVCGCVRVWLGGVMCLGVGWVGCLWCVGCVGACNGFRWCGVGVFGA